MCCLPQNTIDKNMCNEVHILYSDTITIIIYCLHRLFLKRKQLAHSSCSTCIN